MILPQHHACSAYVSDWLEAFGLDSDDAREVIDRRLSGYEAAGLGADEAADRAIVSFLLDAEEPLRLAA